ncbi:tyrosine-type recombinase/integrase [Salmonella enterica]|nr:tyrosine-type recombinase/integrase [Salmonella enterica]EGK1059236.1 tyrosine-type recombinase/integrase [Salmonella enterica]EIK6399813.1 tyrosine-type recombinase/integrase [Salmonella enterica]EIL4601267.1 tyrosine-type recombinase/integrase [Salmonella enterica]EKM6052445.1 tyrosine-type recombinase/integrase [Salmonella enterica]
MTIRKLDDGRWLVDVRPAGAEGKRIRKKFNLRSKAEDYEKYIIQNFHNNPWQGRASDKRRLSELATAWWRIKGRNETYGEQYLMRLNKVIREMGDPRSCNVTSAAIIKYRSEKLAAGLKPNTVNRDLTVLSAMFTALSESEMYYGENPVHGVRKLKVVTTEMAFLSEEETAELLATLEGDYRALAVLCLSTGARYGEAARLRGEHITGNRVMFTRTKNGKPRAVPISDDVLNAVKKRKTGRLFGVDYVKFREALKAVKPDLPKGQATHVLRHTFATHFMMNGGNIITLQRILGHATIQQTMTYAHFAPDFLQEAVSYNPIAGMSLE